MATQQCRAFHAPRRSSVPTHRLSRRSLVQSLCAATIASGVPRGETGAQPSLPAYSYPMGAPGQASGDGVYLRVAYAAENARYYPGWWHTGENWHGLYDQTVGMDVYAVAAGEVLFAGYDYPGLVVIIRHADGLYAVYGHLDRAVAVEVGTFVERGQRLGAILARSDDLARSHLHFELRTFYTKLEINGDAPRYGVSCGYECPPGPGYWPMAAPEHPSHLGWLNPTHVINRRAWPEGVPDGTEVVVAAGAPESTTLWSAPTDAEGYSPLGELPLRPGMRVPLLAIDAGLEDALGTSAEATRLWYRIATAPGEEGWVQAAVPTATDNGADGRPSSLRLDFLPVSNASGARG